MFSYKVVDEETHGPFQQIDVLNNLICLLLHVIVPLPNFFEGTKNGLQTVRVLSTS
jgi:hypothetical protein